MYLQYLCINDDVFSISKLRIPLIFEIGTQTLYKRNFEIEKSLKHFKL